MTTVPVKTAYYTMPGDGEEKFLNVLLEDGTFYRFPIPVHVTSRLCEEGQNIVHRWVIKRTVKEDNGG